MDVGFLVDSLSEVLEAVEEAQATVDEALEEETSERFRAEAQAASDLLFEAALRLRGARAALLA